jgi:nicotinamidase-related amidase
MGTDAQRTLRNANQQTLIVTGVVTNNSVESTVRIAGNPGFDTFLVEDATFTFGPDWDGVLRSADEVHAMSLANLNGEYCGVVRSRRILTAVGCN